MTLYLIEKAIKPQFTWINHPTKKLQTYEYRGKKRGIAVVIFIGIARSFDLLDQDIRDYLCIEQVEYDAKQKKFNDTWGIIVSRKERGVLCQDKDFTDTFYMKVRLTLNALNSQERGSGSQSPLAI